MFVSLPSRIKQTIARDVRVYMVMLVELMEEMTLLKLRSIERERGRFYDDSYQFCPRREKKSYTIVFILYVMHVFHVYCFSFMCDNQSSSKYRRRESGS